MAKRRSAQFCSSSSFERLIKLVPRKGHFGMVWISGWNEHGRGQPKLLEDGPRDFAEVGIGVIKSYQNGSLGKGRPGLNAVQELGHTDDLIMTRQMLHLPGKYRRCRTDAAGINRGGVPQFSYSMVCQYAKHRCSPLSRVGFKTVFRPFGINALTMGKRNFKISAVGVGRPSKWPSQTLALI